MGKHLLRSGGDIARAVSGVARSDKSKVCWWCGGRPHDGKWHADHLCPELADSPLIAACRRCNQSRQHIIPQPSAIRRLFTSSAIVCSMGLPELKRYLFEWSQRLFGHPHYFDILIAAQKGRSYVRTYGWNAKLIVDEFKTGLAKKAGLI